VVVDEVGAEAGEAVGVVELDADVVEKGRRTVAVEMRRVSGWATSWDELLSQYSA